MTLAEESRETTDLLWGKRVVAAVHTQTNMLQISFEDTTILYVDGDGDLELSVVGGRDESAEQVPQRETEGDLDRLLSEGVDAWNLWRSDNPELRPILDAANLEQEELKLAEFIAIIALTAKNQFHPFQLGDIFLRIAAGNFAHNIRIETTADHRGYLQPVLGCFG